ncbi:MAG: MerR family transcriptional regulator [Rhodospirillales bacterium]|nr:MerR family transcriptional regulator [Rhodospirillales bacterium]
MAAAQNDQSNSSSRRGSKSKVAFRTISEVAEELDVAQHVLRFWETRFHQIRPLKRGGGRRYYRPEDIAFLRQIKRLLHTDGYTIKGVQRLIRQGGVTALQTESAVPVPEARVEAASVATALGAADRSVIEKAVDELDSCKRLLAARV